MRNLSGGKNPGDKLRVGRNREDACHTAIGASERDQSRVPVTACRVNPHGQRRLETNAGAWGELCDCERAVDVADASAGGRRQRCAADRLRSYVLDCDVEWPA